MTKVIVLGEQSEEKEKKKIEFFKCLTTSLVISNGVVNPSYYKNIELVCRGHGYGQDLMFAYDENRDCGTLYVGNFNDGVV